MGWHDVIFLQEFDITDFKHCILGQLYKDFNTGLKKIGIETGCPLSNVFAAKQFQNDWVIEIKKRKENKSMKDEPETTKVIKIGDTITVTSNEYPYGIRGKVESIVSTETVFGVSVEYGLKLNHHGSIKLFKSGSVIK